jgi:hypothetical protein
MRVLVACEFSGIVRDAFAAQGHDAWSCDLLPSEASGLGKHHRGDAIEFAKKDGPWDLMIAHPPCTHLACSGAAWFERKRANGQQQEGIDLFMKFVDFFVGGEIPRVAIENPVGIMSSLWRRPTQIIQPYYFGDEFQKTTCLWLKGLRPLVHIKQSDLLDNQTNVGKGEMVISKSGKVMAKWCADTWGDGHARSRTFMGFANAMADQWGNL